MSKQIIPVVFATDTNYVPYCGVAISSLIENASPENDYEVYVLYDKLTHSDIVRVEMLSVANVQVHCVCVHENIMELKVTEYNHLTVAAVYRLVIPEILPQYDKMLYLDSDIIVDADVAELYNIDIGDNILGATRGYYISNEEHFMYRHIIDVLKIQESSFFNSGILIINMKKFREEKIKEQCFELLSTRKDLIFMDQCALNIICEGKVHFLPGEWNYEWLDLIDSNPTEIRSLKTPAIIHYNGVEKPWNFPNMLLADVFWKYARQTAFYEEILKNMQIKITQDVCEAFSMLGKFKRIAVYGAGNAGKRYVNKILSYKFLDLVLWVDRNYKEKTDTCIPVEHPEKLYSANIDKVIIAIENAIISNEVEQMLLANGMSKEKIVHI